MDPERWRRIESILDQILEMSPGERAAFLDQTCAHDPELRNELESLLAQHASLAEAERPAMTPRIVAEIRRVLKANRGLSARVEKSARIGGRTKGSLSAAALDDLAVDIRAERFYGKTITIEH